MTPATLPKETETGIMPYNPNAAHIGELTTTNINAAAIWPFIQGQADLHKAAITGSLEEFQSHLKADKKRSDNPDKIRLLNCRMYTFDDDANGYALFNPAFDAKGNFGFYMEDVFVDQSARNRGIGKTIWGKISQRAMQENATFIKWVTDERNARMMDFSERTLKAVKANEENLDATSLLTTTKLNQDYLDRYETRAINIYDAIDLKQLGIEKPEELASKAHKRLPLVGFITKEKDSPNTVVAATIAYLNYSTFKTSWGMNVEPMVFRHYVGDEDRTKILHSTIKAIQNFKISQTEFNDYANGNTPPAPEIKYIKWHASNNTPETASLKENFNLEADRMVGDDQSTLILYLMRDTAIRHVSTLTPPSYRY